jgi:hypothetical protein
MRAGAASLVALRESEMIMVFISMKTGPPYVGFLDDKERQSYLYYLYRKNHRGLVERVLCYGQAGYSQ